VIGTPIGFAAGTTGGGDAVPQVPGSLNELKSLLADSTPRVIVIEKEYNFIGSSGTTTATGCRPSSNTCPNNGGQDAINGSQNWCGNSPKVKVTYDTAGTKPLPVGSNKSIVGIGAAGVIRGVGLRLANGAKNVIIQNIHITELNPQYIWGGDAITLVGSDMVWIDHCKFSLIGRQMLVTGYVAAGRVSITNNEYDGVTNWSATCNHEHYWTMLFYGAQDKITLAGNYIHNVSGRAPKVGGAGKITMHAVNNYFSNIGGHSFDVGVGAKVLMEGNVFENVKTPITAATQVDGGYVYNTAGPGCQSAIGRSCQANVLNSSGNFPGYSNQAVLQEFSGVTVGPAIPATS
ncbi:pectin lyase fold/virulence factor, partial [Trichophaea hybrida]